MSAITEAQDCIDSPLRMYAPHEYKRMLKGLLDERKEIVDTLLYLDRDRMRHEGISNDAQLRELHTKLALNFAARQGSRAAEFLQDCIAGKITYEKWPEFVKETLDGRVAFALKSKMVHRQEFQSVYEAMKSEEGNNG